jgi:uncharacterized protein YqeY
MSTLKETLTNDLKTAMRSGDRMRRDTLRMVLAAIKQVEVDEQTALDDDATLALLQKEAKKRRETIADFGKAGRPEEADGERAELEIISEYLPAQMTEEEIAALAAEIISRQDLSGPKAVGPVMRELMQELQDRADGRVVNQIVRRLLAG